VVSCPERVQRELVWELTSHVTPPRHLFPFRAEAEAQILEMVNSAQTLRKPRD
jgi:hypothetical protein